MLSALSTALDGHCAGGDSRRRGQPVGGDRRDGHEPGARLRRHAPWRSTSFDEDRLPKLTANSQADILNSVPTIKAEGGGGEVATNVFIKGLPSGGQYQFTPLDVRRHAGVQLVRPELVGVRRLLPQRSRHRAAGVRARRRLEPVRARLGRGPHQLHLARPAATRPKRKCSWRLRTRIACAATSP